MVEDKEVGGDSLEEFLPIVGGDGIWRVWGWFRKEGLGGTQGAEGL